MLALAMLRRVRDWHRSRRTRAELEGLSDRLLADIGVGREQIGLAARGILFDLRSRPL